MVSSAAIITILVVIACVVSCSMTIGTFYVGVTSGEYVPGWMPNTFRYEKIDRKRIYSTPIQDLSGRTESQCIKLCDDDKECYSIVYEPEKGRCQTYRINRFVDEDLFDDWDQTVYYGKRDITAGFPHVVSGSAEDYAAYDKVSKDFSLKDCVIECLRQPKESKCWGFNYIRTGLKGRCQLFATKYSETDIDTSLKGTYYGRYEPRE